MGSQVKPGVPVLATTPVVLAASLVQCILPDSIWRHLYCWTSQANPKVHFEFASRPIERVTHPL